MNTTLSKISCLMLTTAALAWGGAAQAQGAASSSAWWPAAYNSYVGLNAGRGQFDQGRGDAYSLYVGAMWTPQFGLELGGTDFGRGAQAEAYGFHLSGVARLPLNETFSLFGRLGLMYSRSEAGGARDTGFGETYGLGLDANITRQWAAVVQFDRSAVHFANGRDRINMASVGLKYRY